VAKGPRTVLPLPDGNPEPLIGGFKNELTRYGDVVLRLEKTTLASAEWELEAVRFLAEAVPEVVVPIAGPELTGDGRIASILPFVPGALPLDRDNEEHRLDLARMLARLHRRGLDWDGKPRPGSPGFASLDLTRNRWWDWTIVSKPAALVDAYEASVAWLSRAPTLRTGLVHGDVYRANVLTRGDRIAALVDWEEARIDWPAWELANAAWEVCKSGDALDSRRASAFVHAYRKAGGPGETEAFEPLLRLRLVADLLYSLTSRARGGPYDERYVEHLVRALELPR
jgi:Ser/Thr protein kinase RdoA (MazF antagonist)